jgi:hypothetical protein
MKNSELQTLVNEEIELLYSFMEDDLKIPDSFSYQDCLCYFLAQLAESSAGVEILKNAKEQAQIHNKTFNELCRTVPEVPVLCLQVISLAFGAIAALHEPNGGRFIKNNESEVIQTLMTVSYARGMAKSIVKYSPSLTDIERKKMLSAAGLMGAKSRHRSTAELKQWARDQALAMRGAHKDVARKLAAQLPEHLTDASKDPERLIYDALRSS